MSITGPLEPSILGSLNAETAVANFRELLYCEARYAGIRPDSITISTNLNDPDGGIDAQFDWTGALPADTFLRHGTIGFQLKTGTSFKPWQKQAVKKELLTPSGELAPEVRRTLETGGTYFLVCFGHDFSPKQRNSSRLHIAAVLTEFGFSGIPSRIEVFGQGQIAAYIRRYPSLCLSLLGGRDEGFLSVNAWAQHDHMRNVFVPSEDQTKLIEKLQEHLRGNTKHLRILGEPGIGKTRLVLEAVRPDDIASNTLYVQHGELFSKSSLFREILRSGAIHPLVLVLDELSSAELAEIWAHLKHRCGVLKIISIDHGPDRSRDSEIERFTAPRLSDQTIKAILANHVGEQQGLDRWVAVCEGSPRVAQAVGENLAANPEDILRSPATVPLWDRFLFGYARHDSDEAKRLARVIRHIALFSRFGFEEPVGNEAIYIAKLVEQRDPSVTWPIFQEIIQTLRDRRVLQGSRTMFIVPWALHIYMWREYWRWHGRGFDFVGIFNEMPTSLHGWFMDMFRYAHDSEAIQIVGDILRPDGIFSDRAFLCSEKGSSFLSSLAEADPAATLQLLSCTIGTWSQEDLLAFTDGRQTLVCALGKIAVWRATVVGAIKLLTKLALSENATYSNNATGTLLSLFHIGPESAVTEASPEERFPCFREMMQSADVELKRLGLKAAESALKYHDLGMRLVGPEYQGLKERAKLWRPTNYADWSVEYRRYWDYLCTETRHWPVALRNEANSTILKAAEQQLRIETHVEKVLAVIEGIAADQATDRRAMHRFLINRLGRFRDKEDQIVYRRLRRLNGKLARQNLESRFQRYVLDTTWDEWGDFESEPGDREHARPRKLLRALAGRVARNDKAFEHLVELIVTSITDTGSLFAFGESLCDKDENFRHLQPLLDNWLKPDHPQALRGYFSCLRGRNLQLWQDNILKLLSKKETAIYGAELVWGSGFNDIVFDAYLHSFEQGWINASCFRNLTFGKAWQEVAPEKLAHLLELLLAHTEREAAVIMVELLDRVLADDIWPIDPELLFRAVTAPANFQERVDNMHGYHWRNICDKLIVREPQKAMALLDVLLQQMETTYRLSYDQYVEPVATSLCRNNPLEAWKIVTAHLLGCAPKWRFDIMNWLKGGFGGFGGKEPLAPLAAFPAGMICSWIAEDPENRASMMAHCVPATLDEETGGAVTRHLLSHYLNRDGVISGISATFHSGSWMGPRSRHLRKKRSQLRDWLSRGFESRVVDWIEREITYADQDIDAAEISEERESWRRP
ncbi:MAG: hypothetical protein HGA96_00890 [Desulfobulbaceae bacterium]|nr:hypothetical protein [Desulfobulbaceae bacterium]